MTTEGFLDPLQPICIRRGDLPHWRQEGVIYFTTFRLSDSLPAHVVEAWQAELLDWRRIHPDASDEEADEFTMRCRRRLEKWLDKGHGSCILSIPEAKSIVESALAHFDGERYSLLSSTVAPNHVHTIVRPFAGIELSGIHYSWKRFTSRRLRELPEVASRWNGSERHLWQKESFDHIVRNAASLERFARYIMNHESRVAEQVAEQVAEHSDVRPGEGTRRR